MDVPISIVKLNDNPEEKNVFDVETVGEALYYDMSADNPIGTFLNGTKLTIVNN